MTGYSKCFFDHVESHCLDNDDDVDDDDVDVDDDDDDDDDDDGVPYSAVKHETSGVSVIFHPSKVFISKDIPIPMGSMYSIFTRFGWFVW